MDALREGEWRSEGAEPQPVCLVFAGFRDSLIWLLMLGK